MRPRLCAAISAHRLVSLSFDGWSHVVEPYTYGRSVGGHEVLWAFLISAATDSEEPPGWRHYRVEEIFRVDVLDTEFRSTRPGYRRNDPEFSIIYCQL